MARAKHSAENIKSRANPREFVIHGFSSLRPPPPHSRVMKSLRKRAQIVAAREQNQTRVVEAELEAEVSRLLQELRSELHLLNQEIGSFSW